MDAADFITFAAQTAGMKAAGARSATSRAYYGAYHLALAFLDELGCALARNGHSHNSVPQLLKSADRTPARRVADLLGDLHSARIKADYRLDNPGVETLAFAQLHVEMAHTIKAHLDTLKAECADQGMRQQIRQKIDAFRTAHNL